MTRRPRLSTARPTIIREIAGQIEDKALRETFLSSTAVRDVLDSPGRMSTGATSS
jgi:hypothetical protein